MRRFRLFFLAVAAALLVPMALLVGHALRSVGLERRVAHQAVAERLFDEMERRLSEVLAREEERPFGQYAFSYASPDQPGAIVRSPLADPPALPFVIGYFQVDPDGSVHSPMRPRDGEAPDWRPSPEVEQAVTEVERTVANYWRAGARPGKARAAAAPQSAGSTLELTQRFANAPAGRKDESAGGRPGSAFDALRALNKGVEQRTDRQAKVAREYQAPQPWASADAGQPARTRGFGPTLEADVDARGRSNEATRFELSPMVGRVIDARHLVLYRTVVHETQGYHQGLLIDVDRLGTWLREQALGSTGLGPYTTVAFATPLAPAPSIAAEFVYQHRFAEPFEDLSARLGLAALPGVGPATYMYALSGLLLAATLLGLAALYRMVAVVVRYAEQRGNFVAAVTHELKTPLTAIRMYGEMLRDGMVASETKRDEYHRHITAESERLTRLVNNVLELSRLEKGARPIQLESAFISPMVQEAADLVRPHVEGEGFTLRLDLEPDLPRVRFERDALMQVLFNLVDNAVKYANGAARKEITLGCRRVADGVCLTVRDHGPGVAAGHLRKIFEPFYRIESELTRRSKGTGLGLALVRSLADRMGAGVSGRNLPEGGFEVEIVLRAADS